MGPLQNNHRHSDMYRVQTVAHININILKKYIYIYVFIYVCICTGNYILRGRERERANCSTNQDEAISSLIFCTLLTWICKLLKKSSIILHVNVISIYITWVDLDHLSIWNKFYWLNFVMMEMKPRSFVSLLTKTLKVFVLGQPEIRIIFTKETEP